MKAAFSIVLLVLATVVFAQEEKENFTIIKEVKHLPVISQ